MRTILFVIAVVILVPGAVTALYFTVLTVASLFFRESRRTETPELRFLVMVAARNEEAVIGAALDAIGRVVRDRDTVVVVADRCTDATAEIARTHGARVLERPQEAAPGKAAALRDGLAWSAGLAWDAAVFFDADTTWIKPGSLEACERVLASGAEIAQFRAESETGSGYLAQLAVAESALTEVVVPRGRDRLRGWVRLKGVGMVLRREITERFSFNASGVSEDTQFSLDLCIAGVAHHLVDAAQVRFASSATLEAASGQNVRYETGRMHLARRYVGRLVRARNSAALDAALFLASPPLAFAGLLLVVAGILAAFAHAVPVAVAVVVLILLLALDEIVALLEAKASFRVWIALLLAPAFVLWKGWIQVRALAKVSDADRPFEPTSRA